MKKVFFILSGLLCILLFLSFRSYEFLPDDEIPIDSLRKVYSKSPDQWPKPNVDSGVNFVELGVLPPSPLEGQKGKLKGIIALGKTLFFDPRLSGSNQISCSSCHASDLNWTDGREVAIGHDHASGKRNTPTLENIWSFKRLFWDGRSEGLEDQAANPITNPIEMHQDLKKLPSKLKQIKGYQPLFSAAFGDKKVTEERILSALATYQRTIVSRKSDFDYFLEGNKKRMSDQQILGLHLFRTKARCVNCHNGPLFTDGEFHNVGLTYYGRKYEDLGLYNISKKPEDVGKFRTPGLRNVMRTGPWFHNGLFDNMDGVMNMYNAGMPHQKRRPGQENDPLYPKNDKLLRGLMMSKMERDAVISFMEAISGASWKERSPELPK
ncbi:cytochrome c peroxidase [Pedobacter steynii]|uniref:Methylamine utilization protein MauG n=1 Tax=Pedobacter steynii TaxID=430522 RepID=A0A1H0B8X6_9SPHI|nr:cytochrome c peroxidase [Pedobacter steynii]NQX41122.1 cytochrome-c peroxidase [Pedobacter steynii]SDN42104.1 cytochrome c peroxidase [Pedobacter steynii]